MKLTILKIFLACVFCQATFAFQTTSLRVTLVDQNRALISDGFAKLKQKDVLIKEVKSLGSRPIVFSNIEPGEYGLEINAKGFASHLSKINIKLGFNATTIELKPEDIVESVSVPESEQDRKLDPRNGAFSNILSKSEIDALPNDPALLKRELQKRFGNDIEFVVDGFTTKNKLPSKSQIASIKVNRSTFDSEYHKIGTTLIEITTKAGFNKTGGLIALNFNNQLLNARNPFALNREPQRDLSFNAVLYGPIIEKRSSFFVDAGNDSSFDTATVVAQTPEGIINNTLRSPTNSFFISGKIKHNISDFQSLNIGYSFENETSKNLGIGGFNLPERAFNLNSDSHQIRYSQSGNIGSHFFNEFRFQYYNEFYKTIPNNDETTIIVLAAFIKGGANNKEFRRKQNITLADNFLWGYKNHALKTGVFIEYEKQRNNTSDNINGTYIYSNLDDFTRARPLAFTKKLGVRDISASQVQLGAFIQDDFRIAKSFLLSMGLRYEFQNNIQDYNNFSPRIGFAWSTKENGKISVRGGVGIFYTWFDLDSNATILSQDKSQPNEIIAIYPDILEPSNDSTIEVLSKNYSQVAPNLRNPYTIIGQVGFQYQIAETTSTRMQYTFHKAIRNFRTRDINAPVNLMRPDAALGRISQLESSAFFLRNNFNVELKSTINKTMSLYFDYRFGVSVSDSDGWFSFPADSRNLRFDRSAADSDLRHRFYGQMEIGIPKLEEIRFSFDYLVTSPLPYTITTGEDNNGDTVYNDRPISVSRNSKRGAWQRRFGANLSWTIPLTTKSDESALHKENRMSIGNSLRLDIDVDNLFNQTNLTDFVGVQTSPYFSQPTAAANPRKIIFGLAYFF